MTGFLDILGSTIVHANAIQDFSSTFLRIYIFFIAVMVVGGGAAFYWLRSSKKSKGENKKKAKLVELRRPVTEVVSIERVSDSGMVSMNHNRSFVMYIEAFGNNYYEASAVEQSIIEEGYTSLFHYNQESIQFTVQTHINRLDSTFDKYEQEYELLMENAKLYRNELSTLNHKINNAVDLTDEDRKQLSKSVDELERLIDANQGMVESNRAQVERIEQLSNNRNYPKRRQLYVCKYDFSGADFSDVELSEAEIMDRAQQELSSQAHAIISILSKASVNANIVRDRGAVIDIHRRHYRPRSGDAVRYNDLENTNIEDIVTTSDRRLKKKNAVLRGDL